MSTSVGASEARVKGVDDAGVDGLQIAAHAAHEHIREGLGHLRLVERVAVHAFGLETLHAEVRGRKCAEVAEVVVFFRHVRHERERLPVHVVPVHCVAPLRVDADPAARRLLVDGDDIALAEDDIDRGA